MEVKLGVAIQNLRESRSLVRLREYRLLQMPYLGIKFVDTFNGFVGLSRVNTFANFHALRYGF